MDVVQWITQDGLDLNITHLGEPKKPEQTRLTSVWT